MGNFDVYKISLNNNKEYFVLDSECDKLIMKIQNVSNFKTYNGFVEINVIVSENLFDINIEQETIWINTNNICSMERAVNL